MPHVDLGFGGEVARLALPQEAGAGHEASGRARRWRSLGQAVTVPDRAHGVTALVSAASMHGATAEIAQAIADELSGQGLTVRVIPPEDVRAVDGYDAVIVGSAV